MTKNMLEKLSRVPQEPGVYLMKGSNGKTIYVGKALNLKKRLASYFNRPRHSDLKTNVLVKKISTFETIVTSSEKEALILESNFIKKFRPRYNIVFKDDKCYPLLCLDIQNPYPTLSKVRKVKNDGAMYFGPFTSASAVNQTVKLIHKTFKLRKCKKKNFINRARPCLNHQIGACLAPCCFDVDQKAYDEVVKEIILVLKGKTPDLIRKIKKEMLYTAENHDYENAAQLRDRMFALEKTLEKQVAVTTDFSDRDVIAVAGTPEYSVITILFIRNGFLQGTRHFSFSETLSTESEIIETFIRQYYQNSSFIPNEILIPVQMEDTLMFEGWLKNLKGKKVRILLPKRGEKVRLLKMAKMNAEKELKDRIEADASTKKTLIRLQKQLRMDRVPEHIECFDNSNLSGKDPVAAMVVFKRGKPDKSSYRKYKIKSVKGQDDYAYMAEALRRRFRKSKDSMLLPDLLMVDGGKGQLNIAVSIIKELDLERQFDIIGIAKKDVRKGESEDKIYMPGRVNHLNMGREGDLLLFLQRIRDESHRFAISFHRKRRNRTSISSRLDEIPGIGKKRKSELLRYFGTIDKIKQATIEEMKALPGMNQKSAEAVKKGL